MFRAPGGRFETGKFFAVNLGVALPASIAGYFVARHVHRRWRKDALLAGPAVAAAAHLRAGSGWIGVPLPVWLRP